MTEFVIGLLAFILGFVVACGLEVDARKDYAAAGYMIIGKQAYTIAPAAPK